jgi:tRNA threonylcarbamoyladenosine biosynthesis protein TsaB
MLILAFDTSSTSAAVALLKDDIILYDVIIHSGRNHSEILLPAINHACIQMKLKINDIDLFACTSGPGSFTGLRIGVSTMKGLLLASGKPGKPAAAVSSLAALALNISENKALICSVMDAGRGQVYMAYFQRNQQGGLNQLSQEKVLDPKEIVQDADQDIIMVGDGAVKYGTLLKGASGRVRIASGMQQHIRASAVGILGREKYKCDELINPDTFVPVYLRSADARPSNGLFKD